MYSMSRYRWHHCINCCDHLINGNFNKWVDENDFDIAIPLRRKSRVNNALIIQKKRTKNTIDFFNYRLEKFYQLKKENRFL